MAEQQIAVQPAAVAPVGPAPAPTELKMVAVPDASGTLTQGVTLFDDQGRAVSVMTRDQGEQIIKLLTQLVSMTAQANGALMPSEDATGLSNTTG